MNQAFAQETVTLPSEAQSTPLPWFAEKQHPGFCVSGCENLLSLLSPTKENPAVRMTVAENLTEADAAKILAALESNSVLVACLQQIAAKTSEMEARASHLAGTYAVGYNKAIFELKDHLSGVRKLLKPFDIELTSKEPITANQPEVFHG